MDGVRVDGLQCSVHTERCVRLSAVRRKGKGAVQVESTSYTVIIAEN